MKALRGCTDPNAGPVRRPTSEADSDVDANRPTPFVSVVIPVFDDPDRLRTCLQALEHQTYPKPRYEVIVVDNGSARSVPPLVGQFGQARATYEMVPGANAARNRGISLARGEILAFTDADCVPARDWLTKGVRQFLLTPNCGLLAGGIEVFSRDPAHPAAAEVYDALTAFPQKILIEERGYGATANVFTSRAVLEHAGLFDGTLKSGADVLWGRRVRSLGYRLTYAEDVCVRHPARPSWRELRRRQIRLVGGQQDAKRKRGYSWRELGFDLALDLLPSLQWARQLWQGTTVGGHTTRAKVVLIMWSLKYVSAWERLRLQLGGQARR